MAALILASQSPRRRELLAHLGRAFQCVSPNVDESVLRNEQAKAYVERLSIEKAKAGLALTAQQNTWILGSDTSVVVDGKILGKPENFDQCRDMLLLLSGRSHQVVTGIALVSQDQVLSDVVTANVDFAVLSDKDIADYWATGEPQDKAGSYGIQGIGGKFVKSINGSFSAVVGLPLFETEQLLKQAKL